MAPSGAVSTLFEADSVFGTASTGVDPHPAGQPTTGTQGDWLADPASWAAVGKVGFGDLDISEDDTTLYTVNLARRTLVSIPVAAPAGASEVAITSPCAAGGYGTDDDWQPFGIGINDDQVYVGGVCSAESTTSAGATLGDQADLAAYVLRRTATGWTTVLSTPLDHTKGRIEIWDPALTTSRWLPWSPVFKTVATIANRGHLPQPILADIEFDNADLVLGLRDRAGDQFGASTPSPSGVGTFYGGAIGGDILRGCAVAGGWTLESGGVCPGGTASGSQLNGQGPGGGELYWGEHLAGTHEETSLGGLTQIPGRDHIAATVMDPLQIESNGVSWLSHATGAQQRGATEAVTVYAGTPATFGKANGLGDIEALCAAAPIEIGNRVWLDANGDGVQDPSEAPIAGVTVSLRDAAGTTIATRTTDAAGQYLFSSAGPDLVPGNADDLGGFGVDAVANTADDTAGLKPSSTYSLRIETAPDYAASGALAGLVPTRSGSTLEGGSPVNDSNGVASTATDVRAAVTTGPAGANDHTYDFGFSPTYSLGNRVWMDTDDNGIQGAGEAGVGGVALSLFADADRNGTPDAGRLAATTSDASGFYLFDGLAPGDYLVAVDAANFAGTEPLVGTASSTPNEADPNANIDANDNGLTQTSGQVLSGPVTLGGAPEPTGEAGPGRGAASDDHSNLTVDFGFSAAAAAAAKASLGDRVWFDSDRDGRQDAGEKGVPKVTVILLEACAKETARTTTNATGTYEFRDLAAGTYCVRFDTATLPKGYAITTKGATGTTRADGSDADPKTGRTTETRLTAGQRDPDWDMGIAPTKAKGAAKITLTQSASAKVVRPGKTVVFTMRVTSVGTLTAKKIMITSPIPTHLVVVKTSKRARVAGGLVTCPVGSLAPGASSSCAIVFTLAPNASTARVAKLAVATASNAPKVSTSDRVLSTGAVPAVVVPAVTG